MKTDMVMRLFNLAPPRGKNKDIDPQQTRVYHMGGAFAHRYDNAGKHDSHSL